MKMYRFELQEGYDHAGRRFFLTFDSAAAAVPDEKFVMSQGRSYWRSESGDWTIAPVEWYHGCNDPVYMADARAFFIRTPENREFLERVVEAENRVFDLVEDSRYPGMENVLAGAHAHRVMQLQYWDDPVVSEIVSQGFNSWSHSFFQYNGVDVKFESFMPELVMDSIDTLVGKKLQWLPMDRLAGHHLWTANVKGLPVTVGMGDPKAVV